MIECTAISVGLNTELNDLRKMICLGKTEVFVERMSVDKVIENLVEHGRLSAMLHQIFKDIILSVMLLHQ